MKVWILTSDDSDGNMNIIGVYKTKEVAIEDMKGYAHCELETDDLEYHGRNPFDGSDWWSVPNNSYGICFYIKEERVVE